MRTAHGGASRRDARSQADVMLATVGLTDFGGVVMSARPASIRKIIPVERGDRNRAGPGYARKMTEALRSLGVETDLSDA